MKPHLFKSIAALMRTLDLPGPLHPLISAVDKVNLVGSKGKLPPSFFFEFYIISLKTDPAGKIRYGQNYYDYDEGTLIFIAPGQVTAAENDIEHSGHSLLVHPDFFKTHPLAKDIKKFGFFSYSIHEALHLSDEEQSKIVTVFKLLRDEIKTNIDAPSHAIIIAQIELLLNYSDRFYQRQFKTQKGASSSLLESLEQLLDKYFDTDSGLYKGLPSVQYLSEQLNYSPRYLSDMLKSLTGLSAQQHIQEKVIEKAKQMLSVSNLSVAEIAYQLGFERPQSFNKLFRSKTDLSPLQFRRSFI